MPHKSHLHADTTDFAVALMPRSCVCRSSTTDPKARGSTEWVPPGFEPSAVRERNWESTCKHWEMARRKYEVMTTTVAPERELEKLQLQEQEMKASIVCYHDAAAAGDCSLIEGVNPKEMIS